MLTLTALCPRAWGAEIKAAAHFRKDIQPILARNCYSCHGPEKQKAALRWDDKTAALKGGENGPVIVPGKSAESRVIHLVAGLEPDTVMPPKGERLKPEQIAAILRWIDNGAHWPASGQPEAEAAAKPEKVPAVT